MNKFTQAFDKAREVFRSEEFAAEWKTLIDSEVKSVVKMDGPDMAYAAGLDKLRSESKKNSKGFIKDWIGLGTSEAAAIAQAANVSNSAGTFSDRAAALKMLTHLYLVHKQGSQSVWIFAPPKAYAKWVFEELKGTPNSVKSKLGKKAEVYSESDRKIMSTALSVAHKWASDASVKLGSDQINKSSTSLIEDWFGDGNTTSTEIKAATVKLQQGFNKLAQRCTLNKLIFSDEPNDRKGGGWKDWAFVYKSERLDVIY